MGPDQHDLSPKVQTALFGRPRQTAEDRNGNRFKISIDRRRVEALININFGPNGDPPSIKNIGVALMTIIGTIAIVWKFYQLVRDMNLSELLNEMVK